MNSDSLIVAAAGSGKTTFLVDYALTHPNENVLITTYTQANEVGIRTKFHQRNGCIPHNVTVQTWFSFLLQHGVRPYQGALRDELYQRDIRGMLLVNEASGVRYRNGSIPIFYKEDTEFEKAYFSETMKIYSDKIARFVCRSNTASKGAVIRRLSSIFSTILVDEAQDLAGYDLEILKLVFSSTMKAILVGDPRQVTYLTHLESKYRKYRNGNIVSFVNSEVPVKFRPSVDMNILNTTHRNNYRICSYSAKLFPDFPPVLPCSCPDCDSGSSDHVGVFLVRKVDVEEYLCNFKPVQLRWSSSVPVNTNYEARNFGESKGLEFERVLIYPTEKMQKWVTDNSATLSNEARAKLYVGITRAKISTAIVMDFDVEKSYEDVEKYERQN